jgi:hypothetical protein
MAILKRKTEVIARHEVKIGDKSYPVVILAAKPIPETTQFMQTRDDSRAPYQRFMQSHR